MPINIGERRVDDAMVKNGNWYQNQLYRDRYVWTDDVKEAPTRRRSDAKLFSGVGINIAMTILEINVILIKYTQKISRSG